MKNFFIRCVSYWILGILIILLGINIALHISCDVISSDHIILIFVGILATFIVVSNYAQVKDIENKVEDLKDKQIIIEKYQYAMGLSDHFQAYSSLRDRNVPIRQIYRFFVSSIYHFLKAYEANAIKSKETLLDDISTDMDGLQECLRQVTSNDNLSELFNDDAFSFNRSYIIILCAV